MRDETKGFVEILESNAMPEHEIEYLIDEAGVRAEILDSYPIDDLVNVVQNIDNYIGLFDEDDLIAHVDVKQLVTVENSNVIARDLALSDPALATALLEELLYWRETAERI